MTLQDRLRQALARGMARETPLLDRDAKVIDPDLSIVDAAVLVAVTNRDEPGVILTQRPMTMRKHPGQVAFPGGRKDDEDADLIEAALREAEEEVALPRAAAEIIGLADPYRTITGYIVTPVIAVIPPDLPLAANEDEVEAIFETPLAFLMDSANHKLQRVDWQGKSREYYEMHWADRRIWGATAAMIVNLSRRLQWRG